MNPEKPNSLIDEVTPDLEGYSDIGQEPDCEEKAFTLSGTEVLWDGNAE